MNKLDLSGLPDGHDALLAKTLKDAQIVVSADGVKYFAKDGSEIDADGTLYRWLTHPILAHNPPGHYSGAATGKQEKQEPFVPSMNKLAHDFWREKSGQMPDQEAVKNLSPGAIYAKRKTAA